MRSLIEDGLRLFSIPYDKESLEKLVSFLEQLLRWSYRINLTGLKDPSLIVRRLLFDTFFLLSRFEGQSAVDMGSGSGVVAIPTSILKKEATVFSVDSTLKKIQFQRHVRRLLGLRNLVPIHGKIEEIEPLFVEVAFAKAFGRTEKVLSAAARHLKEGGCALLVKGPKETPKILPGFMLEEFSKYSLPDRRGLTLLIYRKLPSVLERSREGASEKDP